jgi:hypothetical protein
MPMAYVLSNKSTTDPHYLFKFDPLTFRSSPEWSLTTSISFSHLGLIFGRNEALLYAFSSSNSRTSDGIITLLDVNGNFIWRLNHPERISTSKNI